METRDKQISNLEGEFSEDDLSFIKEVLIWEYTYENYSGNAFLLYRDNRDGLLYEVHGSHCSCYGLERQFQPELSDTKRLEMWLESINDNDYSYYQWNWGFYGRVSKGLAEVLPTLEDQVGL